MSQHQDFHREPASFMEKEIKAFVTGSPLNRLEAFGGAPIYEEPLVGYASGDDPLFTQYKSIIGDFHFTPQEIMFNAFGQQYPPQGLSVICWALPIERENRLANRRQKQEPALRWAHARWYGEELNNALRQHVVSLLQAQGYRAVASAKAPGVKTLDFHGVRIANWSERHALYAAGLGTFSLADTMITAKGMAMRCGTVITDLPLPPSPRLYTNHMGNCLFYQDGLCLRCAQRCPAGAISEAGHDKIKCRAYLQDVLKPIFKEKYGWTEETGCGLCQTAVPCESAIPRRAAAQVAALA